MTPLWLISVRRRPLISTLLMLLSAAAVLASVTGPLLVRAVHQSSLQAAVAAAGVAGTELDVSTGLLNGETVETLASNARFPFQIVDDGLGTRGGSGAPLWRPVRIDIASTSNLGWTVTGDRERVSRVVAVDTGCAPFVLVSGHCPTRTDEAMISSRDAKGAAAPGRSMAYSAAPGHTGRLRIVGVYDPDRSEPWNLVLPGTTLGDLAQVTSDPVLVPRSRFVGLGLGGQATGRLHLRAGLSVQQEPAARATIADVMAAAQPDSGAVFSFSSQLPALLDLNDQEVRSATLTMLVIVVQAELVSFFALIIVLQRLGRLRAPEWAIGRLRGLPSLRWLISVWAEPAAAVLVGAVVGFAVALGLARVIIAATLRSGTPTEWRLWPVWAAAGATAVAALVALLIASVQILRRPLLEAIQEVAEPRRLGRAATVLQMAVVLVAVVAGYQLVSGGAVGGTSSQLALVAPALLALAAAVVAVRIVVIAVSLFTARPPRTMIGLVVGRRAARAPSTLSPAMVIAAGLALAIFAVQIWQLSVRNQTLRAQAIVGAGTVLTVRTPAGVDLVQAVRRADPGGRYAMAAEERDESSDAGTSRVVAVDSSRLAAVSPWTVAPLGLADVAKTLRPANATPILLKGTEVDLGLRTVKLGPPEVGQPYTAPTLYLVVDTGGAWQRIELGKVPGRGRTVIKGELPCPNQCRLVGLDLQTFPGQEYAVQFVLTALSTDTTPAAHYAALLRQPTEWRENIGKDTDPDRPAIMTPVASKAGLEVTAQDIYGGELNRIGTADIDDPLPALVQQSVQAEPFADSGTVVIGTGLDGQSQLLSVVARVPVLPRALADGVLVDLSDAAGLVDPANDAGSKEVWLSTSAPAGIDRALVAQKIEIVSTQRLSDVRDELLQEAVSRGALLINVLAAAALLIAALTFIGGRAIEAGRRRQDWATLADAGVSEARIRLLCFVEVALPALLGVLIGVGSGAATVLAASARLSLVNPTAAGPPLDLSLDWGWIGLLAGGAVAVIMVIAFVGALLETSNLNADRRSGPPRGQP